MPGRNLTKPDIQPVVFRVHKKAKWDYPTLKWRAHVTKLNFEPSVVLWAMLADVSIQEEREEFSGAVTRANKPSSIINIVRYSAKKWSAVPKP